MTEDVENFWSSELGERVDILPDGWSNCPADYSVYVAGDYMVTLASMADVESWLEIYFVVSGQ